MNGREAFELVRAYAALGYHRTGTDVDRATSDWLAWELTARGAGVESQNWPFTRYVADVTVKVDGQRVPAEPLFYSGINASDVRNPLVGTIEAHCGENDLSTTLARYVEQAVRSGRDGIVLATRCPTDNLCAINRAVSDAVALPVVLVPGRLRAQLVDAELEVSFNASVRAASSTNVIARFAGPAGTRPIIVTTPQSGWFSCAGERGCGLALAIHLIQELRDIAPVVFIAPSGHELGYAGAAHLVERFDEDVAGVIHIGSCLANIDGELEARYNGELSVLDRLCAQLARIDAVPVVPERPLEPAGWVGESECWAPRGIPMLSVAGTGPHFHTQEDVPETVTTPALLQDTLNAVSCAAKVFASGLNRS